MLIPLSTWAVQIIDTSDAFPPNPSCLLASLESV